MAARVARDIPNGAYVNLGIGLPTMVANHLPKDREIILHTENGLLGMGPAPEPGAEDVDLINAGPYIYSLRLEDGTQFNLTHHRDGNTHELSLAGSKVLVDIIDPLSVPTSRLMSGWYVPLAHNFASCVSASGSARMWTLGP